MNTLHLTDRELAIVKQSVESFNDMSNDLMFEEISFNLYPKDDEPSTLNAEQATELRKELVEMVEKQLNIRTLMTKVGGRVNIDGYSV